MPATPASRSLPAGLLALVAITTIPAAHAQDTQPLRNGFDGNIDLIRPVWAPENLPGIDVARNERSGSFRGGLAVMYTNSPLVLYEFDQEVGSVVANRFTTFAGMSVDITRHFTARASIPLYYQWGTTVPKYASEGVAVGDLQIGAHVAFLRKPKTAVGLKLDVTAPTGRRGFYAGEPLPVLQPGLLLAFDVGIVRIAGDLGANVRFSTIDTKQDFVLGSELVANVGVRVSAIRDKLDVGVALYSRFGFGRFLGSAESTGEVFANVAYKAMPWLWFDIGVGRGFTRGYGSSDIRALAGLRFQRVRKPIEEVAEFADEGKGEGEDQGGLKFNVRELQRLQAEGEGEAEKEPEWAEGQFARVEAARIVYRETIQFDVGTANIKPQSYAVLDGIADLMNSDARIAHVIIEGHASPEGPFEMNYKLSQDRAASIWKRLVEQGVHPSRLSYRGMGEVMPVTAGDRDADLEGSRRVVFHVTRQYESWETPPPYEINLQYPWSGESYQAIQPRMPSAEEIAAEAAGDLVGPRARPEKTDDGLDDVKFDDQAEEDVQIEGAPAPAPKTEETP
jgi:outer membrane protein OmpA-like peptidoglycan-associated protein